MCHEAAMTNKMTGRKRRPGGGRKPAGPISGKTANFSTRITAETRAAMDAEAAKTGRSISQVAEELLGLGLLEKRDREQKQNPTEALLYLIRQLAEKSDLPSPTGKTFKWHSDRFICQALGVAVSHLIEHLRPGEESDIREHFAKGADVHPLYKNILSSPELWGNHVFLGVWNDLCSVAPPSQSEVGIAFGMTDKIAKEVEADWVLYASGLDRARRALGFKKGKS